MASNLPPLVQLQNASVKLQRAREDAECVDPVSGYTTDDIVDFIRVLGEEHPEVSKSSQAIIRLHHRVESTKERWW